MNLFVSLCVIFLVSKQVYMAWCPLGTAFVKFRDHFECQRCTKCLPGYELSLECNNIHPHKGPIYMNCKPCANGTYTPNSYSSCRMCSPPCGKNEYEAEPCHASQNRHCECKVGYTRHIATSVCMEKSYVQQFEKSPYAKMLKDFISARKN